MNKKNEQFIFIMNPNAGKGRPQKSFAELKHLLQSRQIKGKIVVTKTPKQAIQMAKKYADEGVENIVAIGGDGTLHEVVNGVMQSENHENIYLGLLPLGSSNDFAKGLGFSDNLEENVDRLKIEEYEEIDIGRLEDMYFVNSLGIGFDAKVAKKANENKRLRGLARYLWAVFMSLKDLRPYPVEITIRNFSIKKDVLLISVGNGRLTGGGFKITPNANPKDQQFDITAVDFLSKMKIMRLLPKAIKGKHLNHPAVYSVQSDHIRVESEVPLPVYLDGEIPTLENAKDLSVELLPKALKLYV